MPYVHLRRQTVKIDLADRVGFTCPQAIELRRWIVRVARAETL